MSEMNTEVKTKFCSSCGEKMPEETAFCPKCGTKSGETKKVDPTIIIQNTNVLQNSGPTKPLKDKWVALILLFFFGWVGAHKFYEGNAGMGILYIILLLSFIGAPILGVALFVDFIVLLFKDNPYTA